MKIKTMNDLKIKLKDGLIISIIAILTWVKMLGLWLIIIAFFVFFEEILT